MAPSSFQWRNASEAGSACGEFSQDSTIPDRALDSCPSALNRGGRDRHAAMTADRIVLGNMTRPRIHSSGALRAPILPRVRRPGLMRIKEAQAHGARMFG